MATTLRKIDPSLLPADAAAELYDFYSFLLQKHRRQKRKKQTADNARKYPLRGLPYKYDAPFEPVVAEDWEVMQ